MCSALAHWATRTTNATFRSIQAGEGELLASGVEPNDLLAAAYAITPDGLVRGALAVLAALSVATVPWLRVVAAVLKQPALKPLAAAGYRVVANNRARISSVLRRLGMRL